MQPKAHPLLSIVMPVYNNTHYLSIMIDCILANTLQDWELLAIDDGSEEDTLTALRQYEAADKRIVLIQREKAPKGAQTCRNIGLRKAKGEYIIFFDSDDYITEECLQTRIEAIRARTDLDFMVFPSGVMENDTFFTKHRYLYGYPVLKDDIEYFCRRILPFVVWNNIYRTASLRKNDITWDTNLHSLQDADFNLSTILSGMKYEYFQCKPHFAYRIDANTASISKKLISDAHRKSHLYAINKFYTSIQDRYGHKYDGALFMGTVFLYNSIFGTKVDISFAKEMVKVVKHHSYRYSLLLKAIIIATQSLEILLPSKLARQIPMAACLIKYYRLENKKLNRICKIHTIN